MGKIVVGRIVGGRIVVGRIVVGKIVVGKIVVVFALAALLYGCTDGEEPSSHGGEADPSTGGDTPNHVSSAEPPQGGEGDPGKSPSTEEEESPSIVPVSIPQEPARHSFTGQATHLDQGLYSAFYPLGWSPEGRFAWVHERRVNDMALGYRSTWNVLDTTTGDTQSLSVSFDDADHDLAGAWARREAEIGALLDTHGIQGPAPKLQSFPLTFQGTTLEVAWRTESMDDDLQKRVVLTLTGSDGRSAVLYDQVVPDLGGPEGDPALLASPHGPHAAVLVPVVVDQPVEALKDVRYPVVPLPSASNPADP